MRSHRHTVQFLFLNLKFHNKNGIILKNSPAKLFLCNRDITLVLDTHKTCVQGYATTMESTDLDHSNPLSAAARHFLHL